MTRHELASFALKLLGIYALIESLPFLQYVGAFVYMPRSGRTEFVTAFWNVVIILVPLLLAAGTGVMLIVFSRHLAPLLVGEDRPLGMSSAVTGRDVQAIGFSVVAVLIFLRAIPQISQAIWVRYYAVSREFAGPGADRMAQEVWRYGIPGLIQLVLAVVLFLHARGLASLWHRIRVGGTDGRGVPPDQHRP
jgi:hypothetical protein